MINSADDITKWFYYAYMSTDNSQRQEYSQKINSALAANPNQFLSDLCKLLSSMQIDLTL